jgi:hypothetical protein
VKLRISPGVAGSVLLLLQAAPATQARSLPERLRECAGIAEAGARLACYDALAIETPGPAAPPAAAFERDGATPASAAPAVAASAAAAGPKVTPEQAFGREQALFTQSVSGEQAVREISATITTVRATKDGRFSFELDNGQLWVQTEAPTQQFALRPGDAVTIRRGALNSFVLQAPSKRSTRVRRLR